MDLSDQLTRGSALSLDPSPRLLYERKHASCLQMILYLRRGLNYTWKVQEPITTDEEDLMY
ncbi:hypothetical protein M514_23347 [Trichuris suis]|uniref:Uncharacterized protein n=1 Tax=Trichuris suis TaxID=68888 RepID=A0A085N4V4_9BILA|nr:hypothetical protein M514_23347 [Trichuris suis]